jgi:hypothetical protein
VSGAAKILKGQPSDLVSIGATDETRTIDRMKMIARAERGLGLPKTLSSLELGANSSLALALQIPQFSQIAAFGHLHGIGTSTARITATLADIQTHEVFQRLNWSRELLHRIDLSAIAPGLSHITEASEMIAQHMSRYELFAVGQKFPNLAYFSEAVAISQSVLQSSSVNKGLVALARQFRRLELPEVSSLAEYGRFLSAAGIWVPRFPTVRRLSASEKRRRVRASLSDNRPPAQVRKAQGLIYQYERLLREIVEEAMTDEYGIAWAEERLPQCGCQDLLGKWERKGGNVLDHADFAHYKRIMTNEAHHTDVFHRGFDCRIELGRIISELRGLRALSHHGHGFTMDNLRDLRILLWLLIKGLEGLIDDFEVIYQLPE